MSYHNPEDFTSKESTRKPIRQTIELSIKDMQPVPKEKTPLYFMPTSIVCGSCWNICCNEGAMLSAGNRGEEISEEAERRDDLKILRPSLTVFCTSEHCTEYMVSKKVNFPVINDYQVVAK